jgi:hypothetical protein
MPAQNMVGIVHTAIAVSDLQHQMDFWPGLHLERNGRDKRPAARRRDGHTIELYQPLAPEGRETYRPSPVDIGSWHLALKVTDLDDLVRLSAEWG